LISLQFLQPAAHGFSEQPAAMLKMTLTGEGSGDDAEIGAAVLVYLREPSVMIEACWSLVDCRPHAAQQSLFDHLVAAEQD
jgi:hypothetical protein